jgi:hypothetical protein
VADPDWYTQAKAEGRIISETPVKPIIQPGETTRLDRPKPAKSREKRDLLPQAFVPPGTWLVPVYVAAGDNGQRFNRSKIARAGHERKPVYHALARQLHDLAAFALHAQRGDPVKITLTRIGGNKMDAANVVAAMKYVQDAVADFLGVDDGSKNLDWKYAAEPGARKYGVRIELELP